MESLKLSLYLLKSLVSTLILLAITLFTSLHYSVPNFSPRNVHVNRSSDTIMVVSWTPLTLSEARGFVMLYTMAYTPLLRQDIRFVNTSATSVTVTGLDKSLAYSIQVSAATSAGQGVPSAAL